RPRRNIFYSPSILRDLGWPADADRLDGIRATFCELLRLPAKQLAVSTFSLEHDAVVPPSTLLDEIGSTGLQRGDARRKRSPRSLEDELLAIEPVTIDALSGAARTSAAWRQGAIATREASRGLTDGHRATAYAVSALERYQDCPFQFFARD